MGYAFQCVFLKFFNKIAAYLLSDKRLFMV
nr:MAG TPA: hypothetical protein [Caudoviricetes sp.]